MSNMSGIRVTKIVAPATLNATQAGSTAVDVGAYHGKALLVLNSSATDDADATMTTKLQHSHTTTGGDFVDVDGAAFATVTNAAASFQALEIDADGLRKYVRVVDTIAGATPVVTRAVELVGHVERV